MDQNGHKHPAPMDGEPDILLDTALGSRKKKCHVVIGVPFAV